MYIFTFHNIEEILNITYFKSSYSLVCFNSSGIILVRTISFALTYKSKKYTLQYRKHLSVTPNYYLRIVNAETVT